MRVKNKTIQTAGLERLPRMVGVKDGAPLLEEGRVMNVTNVIWSTGDSEILGWIDVPLSTLTGRATPE